MISSNITIISSIILSSIIIIFFLLLIIRLQIISVIAIWVFVSIHFTTQILRESAAMCSNVQPFVIIILILIEIMSYSSASKLRVLGCHISNLML